MFVFATYEDEMVPVLLPTNPPATIGNKFASSSLLSTSLLKMLNDNPPALIGIAVSFVGVFC